MKDYDDLYLKCDFFSLADVFQNFRDKNDGLSPSHYFSAQSLSWDVILKMRKIKLELISDSDMYMYTR